MFGVDEFVTGAAAEVFDVVDQKGVGGGMLGEEDDLGAAAGEGVRYGGADAGCAALEVSVCA